MSEPEPQSPWNVDIRRQLKPSGDDPEPAAEAIARGRELPYGVLVQTTHWREDGVKGVLNWWCFLVFVALMLNGGWPDDTGTDAYGFRLLTIMALPMIPPVLWWLFIRGRVGVIAGPGGLVARRALRRDVSIDPAVALEVAQLNRRGRKSLTGELHGFLLPGAGRQGVPGLRVRTKALPTWRASRLITRPARPRWRWPARPTAQADVVWTPDDQGRAVLQALGFEQLPDLEPTTTRIDVVDRHDPAERLRRWNQPTN